MTRSWRKPVAVLSDLACLVWLGWVAARIAHGEVFVGDVVIINILIATEWLLEASRQQLRAVRNERRRVHIAVTAAGLCMQDLVRILREDERTG